MKKFIDILAYIGTGILVGAPYCGGFTFHLLIFGFAFLTPQVIAMRAWNLVLLNVLGVIGYTIKVL